MVKKDQTLILKVLLMVDLRSEAKVNRSRFIRFPVVICGAELSGRRIMSRGLIK